MLLHVVQACIATNHCAGLVLRLIHDFAIISAVKLGHRHEGSSKRVSCVARPQVALHKGVDCLVREAVGSEPVALAQHHEHRTFAAL